MTNPAWNRRTGWDADAYQAHMDRAAEAAGDDAHGEADVVASYTPGSVLDMGCGTGRVGIELARRGIEVVGVDPDGGMLAVARRLAPDVTWVEADGATADLARTFDVVLMAGNVPLFTTASNRPGLVAACARHLCPDGVLVAGFSTDRGYTAADYDADARAAGLRLLDRWSTWDRTPWTGTATYAVSVHRRA